MTTPIAVLILAAGASKRMGSPKQLLAWKNTTLLGNAVETAKASKAADIYVVLGANASAIGMAISKAGISAIANKDWQIGMGTSIAAGINYFIDENKSYQAVLILLCDQPLISTAYLDAMINNFEARDKGIVATKYGNKAGVPALFDQKYFKVLKALKGDKGAKRILERHSTDLLLLDAAGMEVDLDTGEDYNALLQRLLNKE